MLRGGYTMIDLHDINLVTDSATPIKGTHDAVEGNYRKPIILTGLTIDGVECSDRFVNLSTTPAGYKGVIGLTSDSKLVYITIADNDDVTISKQA